MRPRSGVAPTPDAAVGRLEKERARGIRGNRAHDDDVTRAGPDARGREYAVQRRGKYSAAWKEREREPVEVGFLDGVRRLGPRDEHGALRDNGLRGHEKREPRSDAVGR